LPRIDASTGRLAGDRMNTLPQRFKRDLPNAEIRFVDTGHFALETHAFEVATAIVNFLT